MTDADLAALELDTYAINPEGEVIAIGCDRAVVTRTPDVTVISLMGTNDAAGWISNFRIVGAVPAEHPEIGVCESGFLAGAEALWPMLVRTLDDRPVILQGHSRGAGMVPILAAFMLRTPHTLSRVVMWEAPWCVGPVCKQLLIDAEVDGVQWWHGDDVVPTIPAVPWLVPNVWPLRHFGCWALNPLDCHTMAGIVAELHNTRTPPP